MMTTHHSKSATKPTATKPDKIVGNLNRINGQIDGITKMYESDRDCIEVVRQIAAARSALGSVAKQLLSQQACRCSREKDYQELELVIKELVR